MVAFLSVPSIMSGGRSYGCIFVGALYNVQRVELWSHFCWCPLSCLKGGAMFVFLSLTSIMSRGWSYGRIFCLSYILSEWQSYAGIFAERFSLDGEVVLADILYNVYIWIICTCILIAFILIFSSTLWIRYSVGV